MKKKILAIAMTAIVAALGLTGCNNGMGINDDGTYTWKMALNSTEGDNAYDTGAPREKDRGTDGWQSRGLFFMAAAALVQLLRFWKG